ncbi:helix-turn-helix domain-containing protein [Amnibacterium setariae]|uniref:DNA-binding protein n=1 Tax=Amnibacterium setariae TaxID=2306585 RepID=A0A3A1TU75_9MICO|nr:helix-turn-helix domain-containing protein [Amnibacterium setariae]RIX26474.1 DNA-binding protein [Amnibacterium setariae]
MSAPGFVQGVVLPPAICLFLEREFDFNRLRGSIRGDDPDVDATLQAIHKVAMAWLDRVDATPRATDARPAVHWFTPAEAAARLGVKPDTIRRGIREHRLPAEKHQARWRIPTAALDAYRRSTA